MTIKVRKKKQKAYGVMGGWERANHPIWRAQGGRDEGAASGEPSRYLGRAIPGWALRADKGSKTGVGSTALGSRHGRAERAEKSWGNEAGEAARGQVS